MKANSLAFYSTLYLILTLLLSCQNNQGFNEELLLGKWKVVSCDIQSTEISPSLIQGAAAEIQSSVYTFDAEGKLTLDAPANDEHINGNWSFNPEENSLSLIHEYDEASTQEKYQVQNFEKGKMQLFQDMGELGSMKLNLEKKP